MVAGTGFAEMGNHVVCVDNDIKKLSKLQNGVIPIYEPGLEDLIKNNVTNGRLQFSSDLPAAVRSCDICFIAVGTPQSEDGSADLQCVEAVARDIGQAINGYKIIVNKSTVPVGTALRVSEIIAARTKHPFDVISNPEFLKQGGPS